MKDEKKKKSEKKREKKELEFKEFEAKALEKNALKKLKSEKVKSEKIIIEKSTEGKLSDGKVKKKKNQAKGKGYNYFDCLVAFTDYSCQAAVLLHSTLTDYDPTKLEAQMKRMHEIEHAADLAKHEMMRHLLKEFLPPIDREDISSIAQEIDNVTDTIEDVLMQMYMYNIKTIRKEALEFSETIVSCCNALKKATEDFHNFKKASTVLQYIINVNNMEEDGDKIYTRALRDLYTTSTDPIEIMAWTKNFDYLEKCCDACENVADLMEYIIMKNS